MLTYVFPGQGSQRKGMGESLFDQFKDLLAKADAILGYSVKELCLNDPVSQLTQTRFTQPALYIVNALTYLKRIGETGKKPHFVAGHSLGEYNALFAAGVFDFETGLKLVKKRGELMHMASNGGMAAVVGLQLEQISDILKNHSFNSIDIANHNTSDQVVISGLKEDIEKAGALFRAQKEVKLYLPLNVSGAFHSKHMRPAKEAFEEVLKLYDFHTLQIPVISNVFARPYENGQIKATLAQQIDRTVRWFESIHYLINQGDMDFEEIGPGTVLTGLIQKIKSTRELQNSIG